MICFIIIIEEFVRNIWLIFIIIGFDLNFIIREDHKKSMIIINMGYLVRLLSIDICQVLSGTNVPVIDESSIFSLGPYTNSSTWNLLQPRKRISLGKNTLLVESKSITSYNLG